MITRENIIEFYRVYKINLKKEDQVLSRLLQAEDQEAWVAKIKRKAQTMRSLYTENEALLNLYVRPFTEDESRLTDELAKEFLNQVVICHRNLLEDDLAIREVAEMLERYFRRKGMRDERIQALNVLGGVYNGVCLPEERSRCSDCFREILSYKDEFFSIEDADVRKRIVYAFYNYVISLLNVQLEKEDRILQILDEALAFYQDERVRALHPDFDFDGLIEELKYDVLGNCIMSCDENPSDKLLSRAKAILGELYAQKLKECGNPYEILDEIYCNYHKCLFLGGEVSFDEFIRDYKAFCDYVYEHEQMDSQPGISFVDSRLFQTAVNHLPSVIELIRKYGNGGYQEIRRDCLEKYLNVIKQVPRVGSSSYVNDTMCRSLTQMLELIPDDEANGRLIMQLLLSRDETTLLHSSMVGQIATRILSAVIDQKPELLVGTPGCPNLVAVLENRAAIRDFVWEASRVFDIGKLRCGEIVEKQSRGLTAREMAHLRFHTQDGAKMLEKSQYLSQYRDVILGHHKSYDGKLGYPEEFDNTASPYRFYIELLHLSDCIDAATDYLGRSYRSAKSWAECLEELELGMGTLYSPELVSLLLNDEGLKQDLSYILSAGRNRTCYEIYSQTIGCAVGEESPKEEPAEPERREELLNLLQESESVSARMAKALAKGSMLVLSVDMRSADYQVIYRGGQPLFSTLQDGKYSDFLKQVLAPVAKKEDWEKRSAELRLSKLIHLFGENDGIYETNLRLQMEGTYRWVRLRFVKTGEFNAIPSTMAVIVQDVHENRRRMERLIDEMKRSYHAAENANRAKTEFLSHMSHDIRTPMNGIIGMTRIALKNLDNRERVLDCLTKIDESSQHLLRLINEVLDMSRIESGSTELMEEAVSIQAVFRETCDICRLDAEKKGQTFTADADALKQDSVLADAVRLRQILINLVGNAIKYTPDGGKVGVRVWQLPEQSEEYGSYCFEVRDNGIGMSREFQEKMFEPFAREDTSLTGKTTGTGLGLAITKTLVEMMGGKIGVESEKGCGSRFTVTLRFPIAHAPEPEETTPEPEKAEPVEYQGHRILLVEDNALNCEIALELLQSIGLTVETAENGQEALEKVKSRGVGWYELVFMDVQMPVMNGYEATRAIRALGTDYAKKLPIIAMTANAFKSDVMNALQCGMNGHTPKPIDVKQVYEILNKWLRA